MFVIRIRVFFCARAVRVEQLANVQFGRSPSSSSSSRVLNPFVRVCSRAQLTFVIRIRVRRRFWNVRSLLVHSKMTNSKYRVADWSIARGWGVGFNVRTRVCCMCTRAHFLEFRSIVGQCVAVLEKTRR